MGTLKYLISGLPKQFKMLISYKIFHPRALLSTWLPSSISKAKAVLKLMFFRWESSYIDLHFGESIPSLIMAEPITPSMNTSKN